MRPFAANGTATHLATAMGRIIAGQQEGRLGVMSTAPRPTSFLLRRRDPLHARPSQSIRYVETKLATNAKNARSRRHRLSMDLYDGQRIMFVSKPAFRAWAKPCRWEHDEVERVEAKTGLDDRWEITNANPQWATTRVAARDETSEPQVFGGSAQASG